MRYCIEHETVLAFPEAVAEHHIELRLTPREDANQKLISHEIRMEPEISLRSYSDCFGNRVNYGNLIAPHRRLVTRMRAEVENCLENPFDFTPLDPGNEREWLAKNLQQSPRLYDFILSRSASAPNLELLADRFDFPRHESGRSLLETIQEAMEWIAVTLRYEPGVTDVHSSLMEALDARAGVCQDFSNLLIAIVRSWKIPARYVMGYLASDNAGKNVIAPETHAWTEVMIPGRGWVGFDATQQVLANHQFIPVAVGRDSHDAAPLRGSFKGEVRGEQPEVTLRISQQ
jgi:transglutaminase-like putative cysteine protease